MEKVVIEFAKEEFDKIIKFMDGGEYETVQEAIIAAIKTLNDLNNTLSK